MTNLEFERCSLACSKLIYITISGDKYFDFFNEAVGVYQTFSVYPSVTEQIEYTTCNNKKRLYMKAFLIHLEFLFSEFVRVVFNKFISNSSPGIFYIYTCHPCKVFNSIYQRTASVTC
jgi:hypothetical protein